MKLRCSFEKIAKKANKVVGVDDVDLRQHLSETGQSKLPQSEILVTSLDRLIADGLVDEAYLRGSLGRGHGDIHSDIDLFVVTEPENVEKLYDKISEYLSEIGTVITECHDRLVEDYGGIGFMFVANNAKENHIYQFDLYIAMKGVPPKNKIKITPRIYSKDKDYKWTDEYGSENTKEIPDNIKEFIKKKTKGDSIEDRVELIMQEMLITLFVTNKHMKRGQTSRTVLDNQWLVSHAVEMLQTLVQYSSTGYSSVYLGNEVVNIAKEYGSSNMVIAANKLEKLFTQKLGKQKLIDSLEYGEFILKHTSKEAYDRQKPLIDLFRKEILMADIDEARTYRNDNKIKKFVRAKKRGFGT